MPSRLPLDLVRQRDDIRAYTIEFLMMPQRWREYLNSAPIDLSWTVLPFDETRANEVPTEPGIYAFVVQSGVAPPLASYAMYVGKSTRLRRRFRQYTRERRAHTGRPSIVVLLTKWEEYVFFWYAAVPREELKRTEDSLMKALKPWANKDLPAEIRAPHAAF
jgi:hypothetical protein